MSGFLPPSLTTLFERNQEASVYVGNVDLRVTEEILWELFTQCGPVINVHLPRDKITGEHQGFCFIEFRGEEDADYSIKILHMIKLYGKPIKVNKVSQDKRTQEVGANLFVGNLSEEVDEKQMKDIFTAFGVVLSTKIMRDPESGMSKKYGFVSFDNFDSADDAIKKLNGQYISGKPVEVMYAYKKDTKSGEKHGSVAERILAANRPVNMFASSNETGGAPAMTSFPSMMNPNFNLPMQPNVQITTGPPSNLPNMPVMPPMGIPMGMNMPPLGPPMQMHMNITHPMQIPIRPMGVPIMKPPMNIAPTNINLIRPPMMPPTIPPNLK
jgi:splicing factor 3B subunit 4